MRAASFSNPTLIDGADDAALVMTQESDGPIAAVLAVRDDVEALAVANALPFGLAAYVYSGAPCMVFRGASGNRGCRDQRQ